MIVFDLACTAGHVFEAWFGSHADFDDQTARGLLACPVCGDGTVGKVPMAPRIAGTGESMPADRASDPKAMMKAIAAMQAKLLSGSEHVGDRFAAEARAIHEGEATERPIHGRATRAEAKALLADGVPVAALPLPVREPARDN